ncbi:hypothetical protein ACLMJK_002009 [Lecanora helva]
MDSHFGSHDQGQHGETACSSPLSVTSPQPQSNGAYAPQFASYPNPEHLEPVKYPYFGIYAGLPKPTAAFLSANPDLSSPTASAPPAAPQAQIAQLDAAAEPSTLPRPQAPTTRAVLQAPTQGPNSRSAVGERELSNKPSGPERKRQKDEGIQATSGVVIPSKIPAGSMPKKLGDDRPNIRNDLQCPICESRFSRKDNVEYHFPTCVNHHGNPLGARWDDKILENRR